MKYDQLKANVNVHVRLRPVARRGLPGHEEPQLDDTWIIRRVRKELVELENLRTGHSAKLGLDHIHSFMSDPARGTGDIRYGFLRLHVQLWMHEHGLEIEPLPPSQLLHAYTSSHLRPR